ncbi:MAG: redoxin domain-containing protein, partial [Myxococcales bacterium]|nr:redoxin domain-containing protein [Myxococcales bacterium]
VTISGTVTWSVDFDAAAETAGASDCTYTRTYTAVEDESAKWLCPSCEVILHADVELSDGAACFDQISPDAPPAEAEWLGYDGTTWYRGGGVTMTNQGSLVIEGDNLALTHSVADLEAPLGGLFSFSIAGSLTRGVTEADPLNGFHVPETYACGWPKANPPAYTGDYLVVEGETVPDGLFLDKCEEAVRLHDFAGAYLLIDMAAIDCPPCQSMASEEEAFVAAMEEQGITVHVITLLAPSLSNVLGKTSTAQLENWTEQFELTSPILADRGWGLSAFLPIFGEEAGYPSWVLVAPDLSVMQTGTGYGGFSDFETAILADAQ